MKENQDKKNKIDRDLDCYDKIINRSRAEIDWIRSTYKWYAVFPTTIILLSISAVGFFSYKNMNELREYTQREIENIATTSSRQAKDQVEKIVDELRSDVEKIREQIKQKINEEFNKENITSIVNSKAQERIDKLADKLIKKEIDERIVPQIETTKKDLISIEFRMVETSARNDDRQAFDTLYEWSNDHTFALSDKAKSSVKKIIERFTLKGYQGRVNTVFSLSSPGELRGYDSYIKEYENVTSDGKITMIGEAFIHNKKLTDKERVDLAIHWIKRDNSLHVVGYASNLLIKKYKLEFMPLEYHKILEWHDNNKNKF